MGKENKKALVPKLRFPEFESAPGWRTAPLDKIAERISTKNSEGVVTRVLTNSAEYGVLDQRDYFDRDIATAGKVDSYYIVDAGDYVYNPRTSVTAPVGPISRNNIGKGVMSPLYTVFRMTAKKTDFYEHFFRSTGWYSYIRSAASTGARHDRMSITTGAFMRMPVPIPRETEQHKVADCLSSLDELIAAQGRKVEALKTYKRGLMQQLFPREGETLSRLRFPEFRDAGEWKVKKLEEIGRVIRGASPRPKGDPRYYGGPVPRLMVQDVTRDGKWVTPQIDSLTEEGARLSRPCPAGTLTIVCSGVVGVVSFLAVDACIHDGFLALVDIDESLASKDSPQQVKAVVSTHHVLFFNVLCNELKKSRKYFLTRDASGGFLLSETDSTPFLYHLSSLVELHQAMQSGALYTHHFNMLRRVMEQTACFFGYAKWDECIKPAPEAIDPNQTGYKRVIDLMSHGDYSLYEPREMLPENKAHLSQALRQFISTHPFSPALFGGAA